MLLFKCETTLKKKKKKKKNDQHHSSYKTISKRKRKSRKANQAQSSINKNISYRFYKKKNLFSDILQLVTCDHIEDKTKFISNKSYFGVLQHIYIINKKSLKPEQHDWVMVNNKKDDESFVDNHLQIHPMYALLILTYFIIEKLSIN